MIKQEALKLVSKYRCPLCHQQPKFYHRSDSINDTDDSLYIYWHVNCQCDKFRINGHHYQNKLMDDCEIISIGEYHIHQCIPKNNYKIGYTYVQSNNINYNCMGNLFDLKHQSPEQIYKKIQIIITFQ